MKVLINLMQTVSCTAETFELAKGLVENQVKVSLILSSHIDNKKDWEREKELFEKIYFVDTHTSKNNLLLKSIKFLLWGQIQLKYSLKEERYDYLINTMGSYWDPIIPHLVNTNCIVTYIHDPIPHSGTPRWKQILRKYRYRQANLIVVHTRSFIPVVQKLYKFPQTAIYYVPHCRLKLYKDCWKGKKHDLSCVHKVNFIFFGHIQPYKGLHILAKAYRIISKMRYDVALTIAGSGDFTEYFDEFSGLDNVRIDNRRISNEEIGDLFSVPNAVVVLPYLDATQSGVIVTAMEFGTPIIASDVGGLKEQLDNGAIGLLCKPGNADDLAEKMILMITDSEEYQRQRILMENYLHTLDRNVVAKMLINCLIDSRNNK